MPGYRLVEELKICKPELALLRRSGYAKASRSRYSFPGSPAFHKLRLTAHTAITYKSAFSSFKNPFNFFNDSIRSNFSFALLFCLR